MDEAIAAAERQASEAVRDATRAALQARAVRESLASVDGTEPLAPNGVGKSLGRASDQRSPPDTPAAPPGIPGIELTERSRGGVAHGLAAAPRADPPPAAARLAGSSLPLPARAAAGGGLMELQGSPSTIFELPGPMGGGQQPPRLGRGASVPQGPQRTLLSPSSRPDLSGRRQLSQPTPLTTSRQLSHQPQPTLRRGLSSLRSEVHLRSIELRLRDSPLCEDEEEAMRRGFFRKDETRLLRKDYLQQSGWSNQFTGNPEVEDRYHRYVSEYQLDRVAKRLWLTAVCLALTGLYTAAQADLSWRWALLRLGLPAALLLAVSWLLRKPHAELAEEAHCRLHFGSTAAAAAAATAAVADDSAAGPAQAQGRASGPRHATLCRQWWRLLVLLAALLCYNWLLWTDVAEKALSGSFARNPELEVVWQLAWLLLALSAVVLNAALDFAHCVLLGCALYASFAGACLLELVALRRLAAAAGPGGGQWGSGVEREVAKALLSGLGGMGLALLGARRINRFERHSFAQQYLLWGKVAEHEEMLAGQHVELLALLANPTLPSQLAASMGLRPLRLGQELRFLLRTIPKMFLEVQPAATMADARDALERYNPRIIMFSGHTFMGALAFELDNGRIDTHSPPASFVSLLKLAALGGHTRLEAVFLNGCLTTSLGNDILSALPQLSVVCWDSITEDQAARSFAVGFVDALGGALAKHELRVRGRLSIDEAFVSGCVNLLEEGFRLGDPQLYLHPPGHPHASHPDFSGSCFGCLPPVHGDVVLLKRIDGGNVMLRCTGTDRRLVGEKLAPSAFGAAARHPAEPRPAEPAQTPQLRRQAGAGGGTAGVGGGASVTVLEEAEEDAGSPTPTPALQRLESAAQGVAGCGPSPEPSPACSALRA